MATQLKLNFACEKKYEAFYTGGKIQMSSDGDYLACQCGVQVHMVHVDTGQVKHSIGQQEQDEVTSFALSPDNEVLVVAGRSLLLRQWNWMENTITRTWKAVHSGPVACMEFDTTSTLLATGGSDSTIKLWDVIRQYCTHNLKGHQGVITAISFHPNPSLLQLISAAEDYKIRLWDLQHSQCLSVLESHFSVITSLQIEIQTQQLYSGGRDKVITIWDLESKSKVKVLPVYESVEAVILLPKEKDCDLQGIGVNNHKQTHFITAGSSGILKVWNAETGHCVFKQREQLSEEDRSGEEGSQHSIVRAFHCAHTDRVVTVTHEHNILLHNLPDLQVDKQFVGYNDDILDVKYAGEQDSHIVVATNSSLVKVFQVDTWSCQILHGHRDIVLCLDYQRHARLLVTGSKDNNVIIWKMDDSEKFHPVATGIGHTQAVAAVAFSKLSPSFVLSGSQDCTVKLWSLSSDMNPDDQTVKIRCKTTEKAHDKDINAVTVAPNDRFLATGSQDKTIKLWSLPTLSLLGVFRGHRRGVWCVQFSPVDQCLATSSADGTIKIWALSDFTCVKTFEGHESSVLRVSFIQRGMQLLSSGADGLMKLWTIKTSECVKTFDAHDERVWALAINQTEDYAVTGAGDSNIIFWKDVTETEQAESRAQQEDQILKEQQLSNLLQQRKYLKAIGLAITLDQPFRVLRILKDVLAEPEGDAKLQDTILQLRPDQIDAVVRFSVRWNMNSKHCHEAQWVINCLLHERTPQELMSMPSFKASLEALLPYTERHFQRMNRLLQQSTFVDYTWQSMKLSSKDSSPVELHVEKESHQLFSTLEDSGESMDSSNTSDEEEMETEKLKNPVPSEDTSMVQPINTKNSLKEQNNSTELKLKQKRLLSTPKVKDLNVDRLQVSAPKVKKKRKFPAK